MPQTIELKPERVSLDSVNLGDIVIFSDIQHIVCFKPENQGQTGLLRWGRVKKTADLNTHIEELYLDTNFQYSGSVLSPNILWYPDNTLILINIPNPEVYQDKKDPFLAYQKRSNLLLSAEINPEQ